MLELIQSIGLMFAGIAILFLTLIQRSQSKTISIFGIALRELEARVDSLQTITSSNPLGHLSLGPNSCSIGKESLKTSSEGEITK